MTEPAEIRIARWIRGRRLATGWTRRELAELSGFSVGVLDRIERGHGTSSLAAVSAMVEALGGRLEVCDAE